MRRCKVVLLGSGSVGKTALISQFVSGTFLQNPDITIEDETKGVHIDEGCSIDILDTAGVENFTAMRDLYIKNGEGFLLVYSVTFQGSFETIRNLIDQILKVKQRISVPIVVVGNKCDLEENRVVGKDQGASLAKEFGCSFFETSAKSKMNVTKIFNDLVSQIEMQPSDANTNKQRRKKKCALL